MKDQLLFVYNADSGRVNMLLDIAHKAISPKTYQCQLCSLTHDTFSEKEAWKVFRESSDLEMVFLHKDEFEKKYTQRYVFPVILRRSEGLEVLVDAQEMSGIQSVEGLIARLKDLV